MIQCQLVPFSGGAAWSVGPQSGSCDYAAWSPDGKWMYFDSDAGSKGYHIWRQAFPDDRNWSVQPKHTHVSGHECDVLRNPAVAAVVRKRLSHVLKANEAMNLCEQCVARGG
jgi:hypothetical protein